MVRLILWGYKPKHRGKTQHRTRLVQDLYSFAHHVAYTSRLNPVIKRLGVFSVRVLAPRPAPRLYTKRLKNLGSTNERSK